MWALASFVFRTVNYNDHALQQRYKLNNSLLKNVVVILGFLKELPVIPVPSSHNGTPAITSDPYSLPKLFDNSKQQVRFKSTLLEGDDSSNAQ